MSRDNLGFSASVETIGDGKWRPTINEKGDGGGGGRGGVFTLEIMDHHRQSMNNEKKFSKEFQGEYQPYEHRDVEHPTTFTETLLHLLKGSLGTGVLAMPKAFYHAGYVVGFIGTVIVGLLCTYTMQILVRSQYELCRRRKVPSMSYPEITQAAMMEGPPSVQRFSKAAWHFSNVMLLIFQLGICCVYTVFIALNLKSALDDYIGPLNVRVYMLMILLPLILINWVRNLKYLAPFSTFANIATLATFAIVLYYIFREPISLEGRRMFGKVEHFPLFLGTVLFALEAIGIIMPLENEMKEPRGFLQPCGVLNIGMFNIVFLYAFMGLFGYLRYGDEIEGSITMNLERGEIAGKVVQILLAVSIFFTHALQKYVAIDISWRDYVSPMFEKSRHKLFWEYCLRTGLVLLTFLLAVAFPDLDPFISLFGALCISLLGLVFPAVIQTLTFWEQSSQKERTFMVVKNSCLAVFGLLGLVVGTYTSMKTIIG